MDKQKKTGGGKNILFWLLLAVGAGCIAFFLYSTLAPQKAPPAPGEPAPSSADAGPAPLPPPAQDPTADYPADKLFITKERAAYQSGAMLLSIPKLDLKDVPVLDNVEYETLKGGVGLYDYAQPPGEGANRNTSIAGHRDIYGKEFYYLDKLAEGDTMSLIYRGREYTYTYRDTVIVEEDDWGPIYLQGYNCLTLTTCTPIGVASHRMIVRAQLTGVRDIPASEAASMAAENAAESSAPSADPQDGVRRESPAIGSPPGGSSGGQ